MTKSEDEIKEYKEILSKVKEDKITRESITSWPSKSLEKYEKLEMVGRGTFGKVYKAKNKTDESNELFALKEILIEKEKEGFPITAIREIMTLKKLKHENIIELKEIVHFLEGQKKIPYLVFSYMEHDLSGLIRRQIEFPIGVIKYILFSVLNGLDYLQNNCILHRDIKSSNILVSNKGDIKIADFGLARSYSINNMKNFTNRVVTLWYRCPELLMGAKDYDESVDIWSLGCLMSELICGKPPFRSDKEEEQLYKICERLGTPTEDNWPGVTKLPLYSLINTKKIFTWDLRKYYLDNDKIDSEGFDLLKRMLELDPRKRIKIKEALQHEYFKIEPMMIDKSKFPIIEKDSHDYQVNQIYKGNNISNKGYNPNHKNEGYVKQNYISNDYHNGNAGGNNNLLNIKRKRPENNESQK